MAKVLRTAVHPIFQLLGLAFFGVFFFSPESFGKGVFERIRDSNTKTAHLEPMVEKELGCGTVSPGFWCGVFR